MTCVDVGAKSETLLPVVDTIVLNDLCPKNENRVPVHLKDSCDDSSAEILADSDIDGRLVET